MDPAFVFSISDGAAGGEGEIGKPEGDAMMIDRRTEQREGEDEGERSVVFWREN